jgi:shikimate dehydrogenase
MDTLRISKDTRLCISLASRPSSIGTRFHNWLYNELGLDFVYKACTTADLAAAMAGIRGLQIRGCGVSMPYKQDVLALVDEVDASAARIGAANTIVNDEGHLLAFNTDYLAVSALVATMPKDAPAAVLGSGGMARAVVAAMRDAGFTDVIVVARNAETGQQLAEQHGYAWRRELGGHRPAVVVHATPIGMAGSPDSGALPVAEEVVTGARYVVDAIADPAETPLVRAARAARRRVVTGAEILALQASVQFVLYTGVRPTADQIARATAFARAG